MLVYQLIDRFLPRRLQTKLSLLVTVLLVILISLIGALFSDSAEQLLREQIGEKALKVAETAALNQQIVDGIIEGDATAVQHIAETIRQATQAEYVVVGNRDGIRFSHPDPDKIGKKFVGGDLGPALQDGQEYISQALGTLGPSLRGIVPLRNTQHQVIGFIAVGYLLRDINVMIHDKQLEIVRYALIVLLFGIFGATVIARGLKAAIMGLEAHEIAALFHERNAIISSIREGVVAVDGQGCLTFVNAAALLYLGEEEQLDLRGKPLGDICPCPELAATLENGEKVLDQEMIIKGRPMLINIIPLPVEQGGVVASFRPKDELDRLISELSHAQEYSELLRTQTHEYSNKLHTIAGLIQLGAYQEALDLVMKESSGYQHLISILAESVPDPVVAGAILGKYNRACELKIEMEFDEQNSFAALPVEMERELLVTILGNLLDNAFDAVREKGEVRLVRLYLTDLGPDLVIEVEDSGTGISPVLAESLFQPGITSKGGKGRGTGLALVKRAVERLNGQITVSDGELGGALFTVIIPK